MLDLPGPCPLYWQDSIHCSTREVLSAPLFITLFFGHGCGLHDLVPQPGIKHEPPALQAWSLNHWTTREVPSASLTVASHYGLLDVLSSLDSLGVPALVPCTPGSFLALLSLSPSHTSSVRALSFPPDFRPPGENALDEISHFRGPTVPSFGKYDTYRHFVLAITSGSLCYFFICKRRDLWQERACWFWIRRQMEIWRTGVGMTKCVAGRRISEFPGRMMGTGGKGSADWSLHSVEFRLDLLGFCQATSECLCRL